MTSLSESESQYGGHNSDRPSYRGAKPRPTPPSASAPTSNGFLPPTAPHPSSAPNLTDAPKLGVRHPNIASAFSLSSSLSSPLECASQGVASGGSGSTPSSIRRKPSLASPSPPTPLVPSPLIPKPSQPRNVPAPLNLVTPSSPGQSRPSTMPKDANKDASLQASTSALTPPWTPTQYVTIQRPTTANSTIPESPGTRAMMKRLLAKPAAPSSGNTPTAAGFTSGSESEGIGLKGSRNVAANRVLKNGGSKSEGEQPRGSEPDTRRCSPRGPNLDLDRLPFDLFNHKASTFGQWAVIPSDTKLVKDQQKKRNVLRRRPSNKDIGPHSSSSSPATTSSIVAVKEIQPVESRQLFRSVSTSASLRRSPSFTIPRGDPRPIDSSSSKLSSTLHLPAPVRLHSSSPGSSRTSSPTRRAPIVGTTVLAGSIHRTNSSTPSPVNHSTTAIDGARSKNKERDKHLNHNLTPAKALVEAYKQREKQVESQLSQKQEDDREREKEGHRRVEGSRTQRRSRSQPHLRRGSGSNETHSMTASSKSKPGHDPLQQLHSGVNGDGGKLTTLSSPITPDRTTRPPSPSPYYTVLGSNSRIGEDSWARYYPGPPQSSESSPSDHLARRTTVSATSSEKYKPVGLGRTLTRKISGRFAKPASKRSEVVSDDDGREFGLSSLPERRGRLTTTPKSIDMKDLDERRSLRLSVDKIPPEEKFLVSESELVTHIREVPPSGGPSTPKSPSSKGFWKLVKRLSSAGLREKVQHSQDSPPPVPALPKHLHKSPAQSSKPQPRRSTTTRSSSPISSDVSSVKFFNKGHSNRSSTSSIVDDPPPLPKLTLAQHIIAPSELAKLHGLNSTTATSPETTLKSTFHSVPASDDWSMFRRSPSLELPSLPLPPRRIHPPSVNNSSSVPSRPESPTIPSFSTDEAINAFPSRRVSTTLSSRSKSSPTHTLPTAPLSSPTSASSIPQPPPRPLRSAQRPTPPSLARTAFSADGHTSIVEGDGNIAIPIGRKSESALPLSNRTSSGAQSNISASTVRPTSRRRSNSFGTSYNGTVTSSILSFDTLSSNRRSSTPPAGETTFTFRELPSPTSKQVLSEEEKTNKWDDLLRRSEKAGGTLHLAGGEKLASDRLKFSSRRR